MISAYEILRKGFKVWYGCFISMQKALIGGGSFYINFDGFWYDVISYKMDGIVIDIQPPKIVGLAGLEGVTYLKWQVIEKLKNTNFVKEYKYFTLSTSQYDEMFLLYGYKTKQEMLKSLKLQKKSNDFYISVCFKI